ncbi:MAG TPA: long-chain-acyl-CoA synthetase [Syntrophomonadaceae bacterium]|nr:long-chain-acyl-CoA synthetase [Syntrophomonadaceae bacterium]HNX29613.1 long-chain-acyl-CoA synthetase [Syntrophomonadaceae bacterium]HPR94038.1 long-chain-acyl-CoA synthetase [Syntrophomonadaceae bacterium]
MENKRNPFETISSLAQTQIMSLGSELEYQAEAHTNNPAIIFEDRIITFGELNSLANRYANYFGSLGLKKGDVVALLMENRPEFLIAASGLSKLGVIVSLINNGVRKEVLAHALNICGARMLIVGHELLEPFAEIRNQVHLQEPGKIFAENEGKDISLSGGIIDLKPLLDGASDQNPSSTGTVTSDDVIVYIYTSGTTGFPKACAVTQKRWLVLGNLFTIFGQLSPESTQYMVLPLYHNSGFDIGYSLTIVSGTAMALRRKFSARNFWSDVRKYNVSIFIYVGELCRYIYNQPEKPDDADNPLKMIAGNGMRGDLMEPLRKRFAIDTIYEIYGATEGVGSFVNLEQIPGMCGNLDMLGRRQGEIIKCDLNTGEMLKGENGFAVKCEVGETGLLICEINDLNVFAGYVNNPTATEEKIMRNVLREGDCYFDSGDLVCLGEKDYFSFVDRMGDTFRWKSENVSTNQVSNVVNQFGQMEDVNVYGVQVPGMEGRCGMAAIKLLEGEIIDWGKLGAFVCEKLPSFARPYFIRLRNTIDATNSFKQMKTQLQKEGFDPAVIKDPLYFLDTDKCVYVELTPELYAKIVDHTIKF